jgi:hypothetical protein
MDALKRAVELLEQKEDLEYRIDRLKRILKDGPASVRFMSGPNEIKLFIEDGILIEQLVVESVRYHQDKLQSIDLLVGLADMVLKKALDNPEEVMKNE